MKEKKFIDCEGFALSIDKMDKSGIVGWYLNKTNRSKNKLILNKDGFAIRETQADIPRIDVANSPYGESDVGFEFFGVDCFGVKTSICDQDGNVLLEIPCKTTNDSAMLNDSIYFDVSDLIYYMGHHDNLTGIQRVQSNFLLAAFRIYGFSKHDIHIIAYNTCERKFFEIPRDFMVGILLDVKNNKDSRKGLFKKDDFKCGVVSGATPVIEMPAGSAICVLGAAWVIEDYFSIVNYYKMKFSCKLFVVLHDLIPIYCREYCDQGTSVLFKQFLDMSFDFVDGYVCVSESTHNDLTKYAYENEKVIKSSSVCKEGPGLEPTLTVSGSRHINKCNKYILFVSTIEGRKNHELIYDVCSSLIEDGVDVPEVVFVGRYGWMINSLVKKLHASNFLNNKIKIYTDVSDDDLAELYENSWFTIFPSRYEGWGLPVSESLAFGKLCVCSSTSSLPEVGQNFPIYLDPEDTNAWKATLRSIFMGEINTEQIEANILSNYHKLSWETVAENLVDYVVSAKTKDCKPKAMTHYTCYNFFKEIPSDVNSFNENSALSNYINPFMDNIPVVLAESFSHLIRQDYREWYSQENNGIWSRCPCANVLIPVDHATGDSICYFSMEFIGSYLGRKILVRSGRTKELAKIWTISRNSSMLSVRLHGKDVIKCSDYCYFQVEFFIDPKSLCIEEIKQIDGRELFFFLKSILLIPAGDLSAQIEIMANACGM